MFPNRPNIRDLSVRKRYQGKSAGDRVKEIYLGRVAGAFILRAAAEPVGIFQDALRIRALIAYYERNLISMWNNVMPDRVPVQDILINNYTEENCYSDLRFKKEHLRYLFIALNIPETIYLDNNAKVKGEKAFLLMLYRMAYPRRIVDMERIFGREYSTLSRIFNHVVYLLDEQHGHLVTDNLAFFAPRFRDYNRVILAKIAEMNNGNIPQRERFTALFVDGTVRQICRPAGNDNVQRAAFCGRKKKHAQNFQGTYTIKCLSNFCDNKYITATTGADGMIVDCSGPHSGRRHDQRMFRDSNINDRIRDVQLGNEVQYLVYADKGYTDTTHCVAAYHGAVLTAAQVQVNGVLTHARVTVEWCFGKVTERERYVDFHRTQQLQLQPVGKYYRLCTVLTNAHTCLYGSQTGLHFGLTAPSLNDYFQLPLGTIPV
jgi:hypothetical protein